MPTTLIKPWIGFTGYNAYPSELARDLRVLDVFLKDLRTAVGKGIGEAQITALDLANVTTDRQVIAGSGLTGGGTLDVDVTLNVGAGTGISVSASTVGLANTAVTPGAYTNSNITVDAQGRLTAAATGSGGSGTVTHTGGALTNNLVILGAGGADIKTLATATLGYFLRDDSTWVNIPGGGDALVANPLSQFAATTSLQLLGVISDETGSGLLVFGTSPTLITPLLGTPTSGVLTSCTGLPVSSGISGLGAGIAAWLATPSSANLITAVTDETGTGALMFATSPLITTDITIPNTGLHLLDTNASHDLIIAPGSDITADRTLTITTGDASRVLTLTGDTSLTGTNSGDQTITLTTDVTGSGTGSFAATIAADSVTYAKMQNISATNRLLGRATAGAGDTEEITLGTNLSYTGTTLNAAGSSGADPTATISLANQVGVSAAFMRADAAPPLGVGIAPTWTAVHIFSAQDVHNAGVSLGTSGALISAVADTGTNIGLLYKPSVPYTTGRFIHSFQDSAGNVGLVMKPDLSWEFGGTASTGGYIAVAATLPSTSQQGINFIPTWGATAGASVSGFAASAIGGLFGPKDATACTATDLIGGMFGHQAVSAKVHTNVIGGVFFPTNTGIDVGAFNHGNLGGWQVNAVPVTTHGTATANFVWGGYIKNLLAGANPVVPISQGIIIDEQTRGTTTNNGIILNQAGVASTYKAIVFRDQDAWINSRDAAHLDLNATTSVDVNIATTEQFAITSLLVTFADTVNLAFNGTTGTKIGTATTQKIGFWNKTPVIQPAAYTPTNVTTNRAFNANSTSIDELADVLGTLIADLQSVGLVG